MTGCDICNKEKEDIETRYLQTEGRQPSEKVQVCADCRGDNE